MSDPMPQVHIVAEHFHVGITATGKRIHRAGCRHAHRPYKWANLAAPDGNETALLFELAQNGSVMWHLGCLRCCPDLAGNIAKVQARTRQRIREERPS